MSSIEIPLTNSNQKVIIDEADAPLVYGYKWFIFHKKPNRRKWYVRCTREMDGVKQPVIHRVILGLKSPLLMVDHINGNPLDNRRQNLRVCSIAQNNRNKTSHSNSTSKYLGVCYDKDRNKWAVALCYNRKKVFSGRFASEKEAALAYNEQAKKYFGEFANLNTI